MTRLSNWLVRIVITVLVLLLLGVISVLVYQQFSDGPTGPLMGGPFKSGQQVQLPVDNLADLSGDFEFELVAQGNSRAAGGMWMDGQLYITCDLGFIWSRLPSGMQRHMLHVIWRFKTWHQQALVDGRILIRKDGKVYPATIVRVEDPELIEALKTTLENLAAEYFVDGLGPRPTQAPNDVWFFRVSAG